MGGLFQHLLLTTLGVVRAQTASSSLLSTWTVFSGYFVQARDVSHRKISMEQLAFRVNGNLD